MVSETLVKLDGVPEEILTKLLKKGYYKSKTEAIRAGLLELGKEFYMIPKLNELAKEAELELVALKINQEKSEMKAKGLKYETHEEVKKRYGFKRETNIPSYL